MLHIYNHIQAVEEHLHRANKLAWLANKLKEGKCVGGMFCQGGGVGLKGIE